MSRPAAIRILRTISRRILRAVETSNIARVLLQALCMFAAGFLLSGVRVLNKPIPLAIALVAAQPFGVSSVAAYLGASLGSYLYFGFASALHPIAAGFLILAELCIFHDLLRSDARWFIPASAAILYALIGFLFLLDQHFPPDRSVLLVLQTLALAVCCSIFSNALREKSYPARRLLALCLMAGCARFALPGALSLSLLLGACAVFSTLSHPHSLTVAAACALMLDLTGVSNAPVTPFFCLMAFACLPMRAENPLFKAALWLTGSMAYTLLVPAADAALLFSCTLGMLLSFLLPKGLRELITLEETNGPLAPNESLCKASELFTQIANMLERTRPSDLEPCSAAVFDQAAEQVCRTCPKWSTCWEAYARDTYLALSGASAQILRRGTADKQDLPAFFLDRCCHTESFLAAVNDALEQHLCKRQYHSRLHESRAIVAAQYHALSRLVQACAEAPAVRILPAFTPELGFRARGMRGSSISGDRGCSFTSGEWYYLLLCDGMGSGRDAARESESAVRIVRELICTGFDAQDALQMLNSIYLLRGDGSFSTIDLLQISLATGEGFLHKWGAAPSYLKSGKRVRKIGAVTPPPGMQASARPSCLRISLQEEQLLVLVSDGASSATTEQYIRNFDGTSANELAAGIIGAAAFCENDDRTAVVLCLHPRTAKRKAPPKPKLAIR